MLRTTTFENDGFFAPQYLVFGTSVICDVPLYAFSAYGPLPAPTDADELNQFSALSAFAALPAALAPCAFASFELTMPADGFARIEGSSVFGVAECMMTVYGPLAAVVTPASRNDGFPFRFTSRLYEKTTSADVSGVPSAKCTFFFSWKVNVFASLLAVHDFTSDGIGWARSLPLYVNSVSKIARSMIDAVGSNARCGSVVLIVNELSTTRVGAAAT